MKIARKTIQTKVLRKGNPPPCLNSSQQCRGCFGWPNMIKAAQENAKWRKFPLRCGCTGLTLKLEAD